MTDIVLNVKSLVVKNHSDQTKRAAHREEHRAASITGADVQTDDSVEVINQNHVLATLTDDVPFVMEMVVENGRGYVPATEHSPNVQEIGIIPDRRRLQPRGPRALRDRRNPRRPEDQLRQADDGNLDQRLDRVRKWRWSNRPRFSASTSTRSCNTPSLGPQVGAPVARRAWSEWTRAIEPKLNMSLADLKLSVRASNCLESRKHHTVRDLVQRSGRPTAGSPQLRRNHAE